MKVDSTLGAIQITPRYGFGKNGLGGVTTDGKISNYKLSKNDKHKYCTLAITFRDNYNVSFNVFFDITATGVGSAEIFYGGSQIFFEGKIVPLNVSKVVQGISR